MQKYAALVSKIPYPNSDNSGVGFPLQLLFGPIFLYTNMFKGNSIHQKVHRIVKYLKLKRMNPSIKLRELVFDRVKFRNKELLKETLIIDGLDRIKLSQGQKQ